MLILKNITKEYDECLFKDVNYTFKDTGLYMILGSSGCGKTTLFNMLGCLDTHYDGDILYQHHNIKEDNNYLKNEVGFVFQDFYLIDDYNSLQNITFNHYLGINKLHDESHFYHRLGIEDCLKQKINTLSGGQKQRIALARALYKDPPILLCDEPTGSLDDDYSQEVFTLLKEESKKRLVIVITHNEKLAYDYGDVILTIDNQTLNEKVIHHLQKRRQEKKKESRCHLLALTLLEIKKNAKLNYKLIIGIQLALFCTIFTFSVASGTKDALKNEVNQILPDSVIVMQDRQSKLTSKELANIQKENPQIIYHYLENDHYQSLGLSLKEDYHENDVVYIPQNYLSYEKSHLKNDEIVLISSTAKKIGASSINQCVYGYFQGDNGIERKTYHIKEILDKNSLLDECYYVQDDNIFNENDTGMVAMLSIDQNSDVKKVLQTLKKKYPSYQFQISNASVDKNIDDFMEKANLVLMIFSLLAIVSSCFLIGEVMYLSVVKRMKKIGVFKVLGLNQNHIERMIVLESFILVNIAFFFAVGALFVLSQSLNHTIALFLETSSVNIIQINNMTLIVIYGCSLILSFVSSLIPSRVTRKIDPIKVINSL